MGTLFHNADPIRNQMRFQTPHVQRTDRSYGSDVGLTGPGEDHNYPANVANIQLVRMLEARRIYRKPMQSRPLTPYEMGMAGRSLDDNPFTDMERYSEWVDGYESRLMCY